MNFWYGHSALGFQQFGKTVRDSYTRLKLGTFEHRRVIDVIRSLDLGSREAEADFRRDLHDATGEPKLSFGGFHSLRPDYPILFVAHFFRGSDTCRDRLGLDTMLRRLPRSMIARTYRQYRAQLDP